MNWRMAGPENVQFQTMTANGRTYSATPGQILTAPDFDGAILQANGWLYIAPSGPTSARPTGTMGRYNASAGAEFFDETLGFIIKSDGTRWLNPATGATV